MTYQIIIRFVSNAQRIRAHERILTKAEIKTATALVGGFCFDSEREPITILAEFLADGFEYSDFDSFEFTPRT